MGGTYSAEAIRQSVNKDTTSRRHSILSGKRPIVLTRIRNVDRFVELAVGIAEVQSIRAFRGLVISLFRFGSDGSASESDLVDLDHFAVAEEFELPFLLEHHDMVSPRGGQRNRLRRR